MVTRRVKSSGESPTDPMTELKLGAATFIIRRALGSTVQQAESSTSTLVAPAYEAIAKEHGLHPDRDRAEQREAVIRRVQQAWYESQGLPEPPRVKERREALYRKMSEAPPEGSTARRAPRESRPRQIGPSVAFMVRKALLEGTETQAIVDMVKLSAPVAKINAGVVAYYRHQLKQKGELK